MNLRSLAPYGLVCAALLLGGCDGGRKAPGKVTVRVANVAPSFSQLDFRREQAEATSFAFKTGEQFSYDADTYDFQVNTRSADPTTGEPLVWEFALQLEETNGYTFVLTEAAGDLVPVVLEYPPAPSADAQIVGLHAAEGVPAVDLYLERPGAGISGATPRGSMSFQGEIAPRTIASGDYVLWLTAAGNPANVLFVSSGFALPAGSTSTLIVTPEGGSTTAPFTVTLQGGATAVLYDPNSTVELRVVNGAADTAPRDFAINHAFTPPLFSAVPFATPTAYVTVPAGPNQQMTVTPVGNPGVFELDQAFAAVAATRYSVLFAGDAGALTHVLVIDDNRRIRNEANIRFFNAATQFGAGFLDFVVTAPGGNPADSFLSDAVLAAPGASGQNSYPPGDYDLYVRVSATGAIASGPTQIHLDELSLYGILAVNGPDTATVNVVLLDDFP